MLRSSNGLPDRPFCRLSQPQSIGWFLSNPTVAALGRGFPSQARTTSRDLNGRVASAHPLLCFLSLSHRENKWSFSSPALHSLLWLWTVSNVLFPMGLGRGLHLCRPHWEGLLISFFAQSAAFLQACGACSLSADSPSPQFYSSTHWHSLSMFARKRWGKGKANFHLGRTGR